MTDKKRRCLRCAVDLTATISTAVTVFVEQAGTERMLCVA